MTGKTGAARVALETGCPVIPGRAVGCPGRCCRTTRSSRACCRARRMQVLAGPPVDLDDLRERPVDVTVLREATARIIAAHHRPCWPSSGWARHRRPRRTTGATSRAAARMTRTRGAGGRQLGHGVRRRCWPTPAPTSTLWGRRPELTEQIDRDHVNQEYLPDILLPESIRATSDAERGARGRRGRRPRAPVAEPAPAAGRPASAAAPRRGRRQPDEGRGARHDPADERGDRGGRRGPQPSRVAVLSGPNLAREIALCEPAASVVACVDRAGGRAGLRTCARRRTSGRTPTSTSSAPSSAARSRT